MFKISFLLFLSTVSVTLSFSQINRFDSVTNTNDTDLFVTEKQEYKVLETANVIYAQGLSHDITDSSIKKTVDLKLDIYSPENSDIKRPLFLFIHGGGFKEGSKSGKPFLKLADYFASRGWVFVSVDYRLKKDHGSVPKEWIEKADHNDFNTKVKNIQSIYPAVRDAKAALRWVVKNSDSFNIDTDHITIGGGSAGAMTAIAVALSDPEDFTSELSPKEDNTLGTINSNISYNVKTLVSFWGSGLALDVYQKVYGVDRISKDAPPILMFHGKYDKIVDVSKPRIFANRYNQLNIPYTLYELENKGHALWNAQYEGEALEDLTFKFIVRHQGIEVR